MDRMKDFHDSPPFQNWKAPPLFPWCGAVSKHPGSRVTFAYESLPPPPPPPPLPSPRLVRLEVHGDVVLVSGRESRAAIATAHGQGRGSCRWRAVWINQISQPIIIACSALIVEPAVQSTSGFSRSQVQNWCEWFGAAPALPPKTKPKIFHQPAFRNALRTGSFGRLGRGTLRFRLPAPPFSAEAFLLVHDMSPSLYIGSVCTSIRYTLWARCGGK